MIETLKLIIEEHIGFRKQIWKLAVSDLKKTYRGAALGWAWAVIKPMVTLFVFWFAFSVGLRRGGPIAGYPFFLWLTAGMLPWFFMSEMITGGAGCIRKYAHLVTKMKFPISTIPTFYTMSHLVTHFILLAVTIAIFVAFGFMPDIYYLQIPLYMLMMFIFFTVWSLWSGLLSAISKDFQNLVVAFSSAIFWMSGILYDVNKIRHSWIRLLLKFNPVTVIASGYRKAFIYKEWFFEDRVEMMCYCTTLLVFTLAALWAYKRMRKEIPDVL
jgi:teichoic acid transport system permease protein